MSPLGLFIHFASVHRGPVASVAFHRAPAGCVAAEHGQGLARELHTDPAFRRAWWEERNGLRKKLISHLYVIYIYIACIYIFIYAQYRARKKYIIISSHISITLNHSTWNACWPILYWPTRYQSQQTGPNLHRSAACTASGPLSSEVVPPRLQWQDLTMAPLSVSIFVQARSG